MSRPRIGVFGGTFDPFHIGHLAFARTARVALRLDALRLVPSGDSWQKSGVVASAAQRLAMVRFGIAGESGLSADPRETLRAGPSYTIDTLRELRAELGPEAAIVLLIGSDQLHRLPTWRDWRALTGLAHIACTQRERIGLTNLPDPVESLLRSAGRERLPDAPSGSVVLFTMPPVPVSATALRAQLARGEQPLELISPAVLDYIRQHGLYRSANAG